MMASTPGSAGCRSPFLCLLPKATEVRLLGRGPWVEACPGRSGPQLAAGGIGQGEGTTGRGRPTKGGWRDSGQGEGKVESA